MFEYAWLYQTGFFSLNCTLCWIFTYYLNFCNSRYLSMPSTAFRKTDLRRFHLCEFEWSKIKIKVFEKSKRITFFAIFSSIYQKFFLDFVHHNNSDVKVKRIRILIASSILYIYFPCHNLLLFSSFLFTFKSEFFWSHSALKKSKSS